MRDMPPAPPPPPSSWRAGPAGPTSAADAADRWSSAAAAEVRAIVRRRRRASADQIRLDLGALRWPPPDLAAVTAVVREDPALHELPDGTALHLAAVLTGRMVTTRPPSGAGTLPIDDGLSALLLAVAGGGRVPVRHGASSGLAEVVPAGGGGGVLVLPRHVIPDPLLAEDERTPQTPPSQPARSPGLLGVVVQPEGWGLLGVEEDPPATAALRGALTRRPGTRSWPVVDRLLAALAHDPALCRTPTAPVAELLSGVATLPGRARAA